MLKDILLENGFTEDQFNTIKSCINKSEDYVPKATFNEELAKTKKLKEDLNSRDEQLKSLTEKVGDNEALQAEIKKLQDDNAKAKKEYNDSIKKIQKDNALINKYGDAVYSIEDIKRVYDYNKLVLNDKGEIIDGFEEQDAKIREQYPHYFKPKDNSTNGNGGINGLPPASGSNPAKPILTEAQKNVQAGIDLVKAIRGIKE